MTTAIAAWALSLLLLPSLGAGVPIDVLAALAWASLLVAGTAPSSPARLFAAVVAGALACATWTIDASAYPRLALGLAALLLIGARLGPPIRLERRALLPSLAILATPALLAALAWLVGDASARETLRDEWALPPASFAAFSLAARTLAIGAATWTAIALRLRGAAPSRVLRVIGVLAFAAVALRVAMRALSIASVVVLPEDAGWSEAVALLNLLKLDAGVPIFGPLDRCGSYSYAPTVEILHHALLRPLSAELSIVANRLLCLGWQIGTAAISTAAIAPFFRPRVRAFVAASALLVATSSFLAGHVHPDHLLMPAFALALFVTLHEERMPRWLVTTALALLPAVAVTVKLTGGGVGLGLAFAFALRPRRHVLGGLAAGAALAVGALVLYEHVEPGFWEYTFALQASHPVEWRRLATMWLEPPCRVFFFALAMTFLAWTMGGAGPRRAALDALRVLLVTVGFALPSTLAYLKVGGRDNSLLPFSIGASVAAARIFAAASARDEGFGLARTTIAAAGAALVLTIAPRDDLVPASVRAAVTERHARLTDHVRRETEAGRRTLLPQSMAAWLAAGRRDVPWDRWQTINELGLGGHPEAELCRERIVSGFYDSVIVDALFLDPVRSPYTAGVRQGLARGYVLVSDERIGDGALPDILVYRSEGGR